MLHDGMRLPTTDLHDHPRLSLDTVNFLDDLAGQPSITIFIQVLHYLRLPSPISSTTGALSSVSWSNSSSSFRSEFPRRSCRPAVHHDIHPGTSLLASPIADLIHDRRIEFRQLVQFFEQLVGALRLFLINLADSETHVDQDIVADLGLRQVLQTGLAHDAAELDLGHAHALLVECLDHLAGNRQTHVSSLFATFRSRSPPGRARFLHRWEGPSCAGKPRTHRVVVLPRRGGAGTGSGRYHRSGKRASTDHAYEYFGKLPQSRRRRCYENTRRCNPPTSTVKCLARCSRSWAACPPAPARHHSPGKDTAVGGQLAQSFPVRSPLAPQS